MPKPLKPRYVQLDGRFATIRGNQILDSWGEGATGIPEAKALMDTVKQKVDQERWSIEEGANSLIYIEVTLHGFRDLTPTEAALLAAFDKTQTDEYQEYIRLRDKYDV